LLVLCGVHCVQLLRPGRRADRATDAALAQIAMAGLMAWLLVTADPPRAALAAAFGASAAWFVVRTVRGYIADGTGGADPFYSHAVCCSAMCYVLAAPWLAAVVDPGHAGMAMGPGVPALSLAATGAVVVALVASSRRFAADGLLTVGGRWVVESLTLVMLFALL
jgi:hypothetical protein